MYLQAGSAGELGRRRGLEQVGFWRKLLEHPAYDAFWREQAVDRILAAQPLAVPTMIVHGLWDQEDIYGAPAVYRAIEPKDTANDKVFLVMGPWHHGQQIDDGSRARRAEVRQRHRADVPPRHPAAVPRSVPEGRRPEGRHRAGDRVRDGHQRVAAAAGVAGWLRDRLRDRRRRRSTCSRASDWRSPRPAQASTAFDEYVSDPAKPVPFRARPIQSGGLRRRPDLAALARRRPARGLGPARRARVRVRGPRPRRSRSAGSPSPTSSRPPAAPTATGWSS